MDLVGLPVDDNMPELVGMEAALRSIRSRPGTGYTIPRIERSLSQGKEEYVDF